MNWDDAKTGRKSLGEKVRSLRLTDKQDGSAAPNRLLPWGLCAIFFVTTLAIGYRTYRLTPADLTPIGATTSPKPASTVDSKTGLAATPGGETGELTLEYKGYVIAPHVIQVSPKVGGMLEWIAPDLEEGRRFQAGDLLGIIENVDYKADRDQSLGNLKNLEAQLDRQQHLPRPEEVPAAKAKVREAEANLFDLRDQWQRAERLFVQRVINEEDLVKRRQAFQMADHQLAARQAELDLLKAGAWKPDLLAAESLVIKARAELDRSQWKLDNTFIYAPISGTILTKKAEKGNLVNPAAYSNGLSASLCEMADLSDLEIELEIQERDIARVTLNQPCRIVPEAYRQRVYQGYVARVMPQALRSKSAVVVRVKVSIPAKEEGLYLKPEMGAIVSFLKPKDKDTSVATSSPGKETK
jgi:HlyD family secretion protein